MCRNVVGVVGVVRQSQAVARFAFSRWCRPRDRWRVEGPRTVAGAYCGCGIGRRDKTRWKKRRGRDNDDEKENPEKTAKKEE